MRRRSLLLPLVADVGMAVGVVVMLVGTFLPWVRSGRTWRSSFAMVRTAERLGLVGHGAQRGLLVAWFLVPLLCGVTVLFLALGRRVEARVVGVVLVAMVVIHVVIVGRSSLPTGSGLIVASTGAILVAVTLAASTIAGRPGARTTDPR